MTAETDGIIRYFEQSGLAGVVSDINSPHVHVPHSCHYWNGTRAPVDQPLDTSDGSVGCAVDFAFVPPQSDSPGLRAIFDLFAAQSDRLAELIHANAPFFVKNGRRYPVSWLSPEVTAAHHGHVHVAVDPGTILAAPPPTPLPTPQESNVLTYLPVACPTGGYWVLKTDNGGVDCYDGAPFFDSIPGKDPHVVLDSPIVSLTPFVQDGAVKGYWLTSMSGGCFTFGEAPYLQCYAEFPQLASPGAYIIGLLQTGGFVSGEPVSYKQLRREPGEGPDQFQEYRFPVGT